MSFPRYERYKESGVEWLGEVPVGWAIRKIKQNSYLKGRVGWKGLKSDEFLTESFAYLITGIDFRGKYIDWSGCYQVDQFRYEDDPFIQLSNGDLLITKDGTIGKLAIVSDLDKPACLNSGIFLIRPEHSYLTTFLYWVLASQIFSLFCDLTTYGSTIQHLYQNVFENFAFPIPPLPEQHRIAAFLDRETAKIDALIAEQQRLIALLAEKRQATISHAVTKGLNPDAPMKDSGVEWLGEVPEHWVTPTLNSRYSIELGKMLDEKRITGTHLVPYLRNVDVQWDSINYEELPEMDIQEVEFPRYTVQKGDLLICEGGEVGRAAMVGDLVGICGFQKALHRVRPRDASEHTRFLFYTFVWAAATGVFKVGGTSTIAHLTGEQLRRYRFPNPPYVEQTAIAVFLDIYTASLDTLTTEAKHAITLLQERRTALISAAVTGKINVQGVA